MKINENEIYESLRISTIFSGHSFITNESRLYWNDEHDHRFFEANRKRLFLLRISNSAEFDASPIPGADVLSQTGCTKPPMSAALRSVYEHIPPLWALVCRIAPKRHIVTSVYRGSGRSFIDTTNDHGRIIAATSDDFDVSMLLQLMTMQHGIDREEWIAFKERYQRTVTGFTIGNNATRVN